MARWTPCINICILYCIVLSYCDETLPNSRRQTVSQGEEGSDHVGRLKEYNIRPTISWKNLNFIIPQLWKYKASTINNKIFGPTKVGGGRTGPELRENQWNY